MRSPISGVPSRSSLGSDDRGRLRSWLVSGLIAQIVLLTLLVGISTTPHGLGLMALVGVLGELGIVGLVLHAWVGLEQRFIGQERSTRITQVLSSSLELDAVARLAVDQVYQAVPVDRALLYQWQGDRAALHLLASAPDDAASLLPAQEEAFKQTVPDQRPARFTATGTGTWWAVPLAAQGRAVGVVAIREHAEHSLTRRERQIAEDVARLTAVALYNAITFAQIDANLHARIIELATIELVSRHISATLDADVIASDVLAAAMSAIEAEVGSCLLQTNNGDYALVARIDAQGTQPPPVIDGRRGMIGQVLSACQPVLVPDVRLDPKNGEITAGMRAQLGVPIAREGQSIGVLCLEHSRANAFTETHVRLVNTLAEHAAIALENARLYDEIRTGRDQLQAILDSTRDAILLFDSHGRLLQFNPVAQDMVGYSLAPFVGRGLPYWLRRIGVAHLQTTTGFTLADLRQYIRERLAQPTRIAHRQFQRIQGENVVHIDETGSPVLDRQGNPVGWLLVWRDSTEERKLEMLRQEFSSMVVHDLRNPITSVIGGMAMLHDLFREAPVDTNAGAEVVGIVQNSAEHMLNLVQSLLDISRLEQSALVMDCENQSLFDVIDRAARSVLGLAAEAGVEIVIQVPDDLPPVWFDDEKILRVLINLLDNALRHTPSGGQIIIGADRQPDALGRRVCVRVEDTGPGIPPEERSRVFDKFVQLDPQRVLRGHKGTGLGLTFCKLVVEAHSGRIWVEDGAAGGAAFCFTLPMRVGVG
jgi:NtrC-family two-component system sensor histidine kinase KinB